MSERSAGRQEQYAASAMRRLVDAHESGEMPTVIYRARRRQLLEALARGRLPKRQSPPGEMRAPRPVVTWLAAASAIVVLIAVLWWLLD